MKPVAVNVFWCDFADFPEVLPGPPPPPCRRASPTAPSAVRRRTAATAWLLRHAFSDAAAREERAPSGRPFISGAPPYSLTHAGTVAALAVAPDNVPVGCDLEFPRAFAPRLFPALLRRAMDDAEIRDILASPDPPLDFLRRWVAKEAFSKTDGRGFQLGFPAAESLRLARGWTLATPPFPLPGALFALCRAAPAPLAPVFRYVGEPELAGEMR